MAGKKLYKSNSERRTIEKARELYSKFQAGEEGGKSTSWLYKNLYSGHGYGNKSRFLELIKPVVTITKVGTREKELIKNPKPEDYKNLKKVSMLSMQSKKYGISKKTDGYKAAKKAYMEAFNFIRFHKGDFPRSQLQLMVTAYIKSKKCEIDGIEEIWSHAFTEFMSSQSVFEDVFKDLINQIDKLLQSCDADIKVMYFQATATVWRKNAKDD